MSLDVHSLKNERMGKVDLPSQFSEPLRNDIIQRAVETFWANSRQPYSSDPKAGKKQVTWLSKRRRDNKSTYGKGQSRVPRKTMSNRGSQFQMVGAFAPGAVGGRKAHAPHASRIWAKKLNVKENRKALRSALGATVNREIVLLRGHKIPDSYPFVIDDSFESLKSTSDVKSALLSLGFAGELERGSNIKVRPGRGKLRGRRYKTPKSLLIVTGSICPLQLSARNISGVEIVDVHHLNVNLLAPGASPGRVSLFTKNALKVMNEKRLFV